MMKNFILGAALAFAVGALVTGALSSVQARGVSAPGPPVTLTEDATSYTLANGLITARVDKRSGDLLSLKYKGIETLDAAAGHAGGYWSHTPGRGTNTVDMVTINPKSNGGERAEISVKGVSGGAPLGAGPGGSAVADIEIRYALGRNTSGIYTYSIFQHQPSYPATSIGEARYAVKLNDSVFDWMTVDARRNMEMITAFDWNHGIVMNMKEARLMTTGIMKGQVEHKYDYSAVQFDTPAFGWSSSKQHIGIWCVNPTIEYLSGGPTKLELTTHRDATFKVGPEYYNAPAPPVLLNYWRGSHYGGSVCDIAAGESWTKVIGPFLLYCNSGPTHDALWKDALAQAAREAQSWPYAWVSGVDYPHKDARGVVSGRIVLADPQAPASHMTHLLVGLAHPDYPDGRGEIVDWQRDAKYYQFWVHGDDQGRFTIPNVRPGTYTLHAIATGVLGEYARTDITIGPGQTLALGSLKWTPVRYGRQLWDIGIPNRTAGEFLHGDNYWHWGWYLQYPKDFPDDVNYVIGKSDYHKDWNLMQVPRASAVNTDGRGDGPATTWSVTFQMPSAPHGRATLRLAFAGTEARHLDVTVNDQPAGTVSGFMNNSAIHRDADRGYWVEKDLAFDASLLKAGTNVLKLTVPAGNIMSGVEYDYLRLELDESATAQNPPRLGQEKRNIPHG